MIRAYTAFPLSTIRGELHPARFDSVIEPARQAALVAELDRRGAHLRGRPRVRGEAANPLGGRVWDLTCGWPMCRLARGRAYRYTCVLNQQSDSRACAYNWVDGPSATRLVLGCIRQRLLSPAPRVKLRARLEQLAAAEGAADPATELVAANRAALDGVKRTLDRVSANMARAENPAQYKAIAAEFDRLTAEETRLAEELRPAPAAPARPDPAAEVDAALAALDRLPELVERAEDASAARDLVRELDARLYLRFGAETRGRRVVCRPVGGVVTLGSVRPPRPVYEGPTDKAYVKKALASSGGAVPPELAPCSCDPGAEVGSSGNRQRLTRRCT